MNTTPTPTLDAPTEPALTLDDPAALKAAARIPHTRDCTGPNLNLWQSRRYGLTVACKACRRFIALTPTPARETVLEDAPRNGWARPVDRTPAARMGSAVGAPIVGRYRCPEHPDEPVNARGKGCPRCGTRRRHRGRAVNPTPDRLDELLGHRPRPEQADQ